MMANGITGKWNLRIAEHNERRQGRVARQQVTELRPGQEVGADPAAPGERRDDEAGEDRDIVGLVDQTGRPEAHSELVEPRISKFVGPDGFAVRRPKPK